MATHINRVYWCAAAAGPGGGGGGGGGLGGGRGAGREEQKFIIPVGAGQRSLEYCWEEGGSTLPSGRRLTPRFPSPPPPISARSGKCHLTYVYDKEGQTA